MSTTTSTTRRSLLPAPFASLGRAANNMCMGVEAASRVFLTTMEGTERVVIATEEIATEYLGKYRKELMTPTETV